MKRILAALLLLTLGAGAASAQIPGNFPAGAVFGNSSAAARPGRVETFTAMLDRAFCSTANSILVRTSAWVCLASANNGVLVTSGAGVASISTTLPTGLAMGTPASINLTNAGAGTLPLTVIATIADDRFLGNTTGGAASPAANTLTQMLDATACATNGQVITRTAGTWTCGAPGTIGGSTGATDNAALRADGTGGATIQSSALLIADTTGALSRSGGGGIQVQGTSTNDNAAAGEVGEYLSSVIVQGSAVTLSDAASANMTSLSITAGDWDVACNVSFLTAGGSSMVDVRTAVSTVTNTLPTFSSGLSGYSFFSQTFNSNAIIPMTPTRVSIASTTTHYCPVFVDWTGGSGVSAFGTLYARRAR